MKKKKIHCQNCGAPFTTEICLYCKSKTGIDSKDAEIPYEVIEIFEAEKTNEKNLIGILFSFITLVIGLQGIIFLIEGKQFDLGILAIIIAVISAIITYFTFYQSLINRYKIYKKGKDVEATVLGYIKSIYKIDNKPLLVAKLIVDTKVGKKIILYDIEDTNEKYEIGSKLKLKLKEKEFIVLEERGTYNEKK